MATQLPDAAISKEIEQYENDLSWVLGNYASFIQKYGNEFVAVLNQTVLAHAATVHELNRELSTKFKEEAHLALIEFIYTEHPNFVLCHARNLQA